MADINYEPKCEIILANPTVTTTPIPTAETAIIDIHQSNEGAAGEAYQQLKKVRGNSQGSIRGNISNLGGLTEVDLRIYWYSNLGGTDTAFQKTTSTTTAGVETITLHKVAVTATGAFDYDFPMMACDGLKITIQGVGTNTSSVVSGLHLALRTN